MPKIVIDMSERDFDRLVVDSSLWANGPWREPHQLGRFEHETLKYDDDPLWSWKYCHWLGEEFTAVLLVRSYLDALGHGSEVVFDTAENSVTGHFLGYVILTDYNSAARPM